MIRKIDLESDYFPFKLERAKRVKEIGGCVVAFQPIGSNSLLHSCSMGTRNVILCSPSSPSLLLHLGRSSPLLPLAFFPLRPCTPRRSSFSYTGFAFYPWNNASSNPRKRDLLSSSRAPAFAVYLILRQVGPAYWSLRLSARLSLLRLLYRASPLVPSRYRLLTVDFGERREEKNVTKARDGGDIDIDIYVSNRHVR